MNSRQPIEKGFIGLLSLLITAAIIALIVWKLYAPAIMNGYSATPSDVGALQKAQNVKNILENQNRPTPSY